MRYQNLIGCIVNHRTLVGLLLGTIVAWQPVSSHAEDEWFQLFDGKSLAGWSASENPETWKVEDGCLVCQGARSHLFYQGEVEDHQFKNFELEVELKTDPLANSGIYIHTAYQESGWPEKGYEIQINNSHQGSGAYRELKRTGSLYAVRNVYKSGVEDGHWFRMRVTVAGNRIRVWVNDLPTRSNG